MQSEIIYSVITLFVAGARRSPYIGKYTMIDYGPFVFACPIFCDGFWFISMMYAAGFERAESSDITRAFSQEDVGKLKVTLVKNPKRWLAHCYSSITSRLTNDFPPFTDLPLHTFDAFVRGYVHECPGEITKLFAKYKADTIIRSEDLPWGLVDLLESSAVGSGPIKQILDVPPSIMLNGDPRKYIIDARLSDRLIDAEKELCDMYDYY